MRTEQEIRERIRQIKTDCRDQLTGPVTTIQSNAPLALTQLELEARLRALHWVLDEPFISQLTHKNRRHKPVPKRIRT